MRLTRVRRSKPRRAAKRAKRQASRSKARWSISVMHGQSPALRRPPYVDGVFALDDPKPGLVNAGRYALGLF